MSDHKKLVIYPQGAGMLFLLFLFSLFLVMGVGLFINEIINYGQLGHPAITFIATLFGIGFGLWGIIVFIVNGKVTFTEKKIIYKAKGHDKSMSQILNIDCNQIIDFSNGVAIEFTLDNGKKITFYSVLFSNKQRCNILKNIQLRGGLQGKDISLYKY